MNKMGQEVTFTFNFIVIGLLLAVSLIQIQNTSAQSLLPQENVQQSAGHQFLKQDQDQNQKITGDSRCGGMLESSTEPRYLSYKYGKAINNHESCIWTVHAGNWSVIKLTNIETYFRDRANVKNYISVGFFNESNYDLLESFTWIKLPFSLIPQSVEIPGPVGFIHFVSTTAAPGLGFQMTFQSGGKEEPCTMYNYENYFVEGNSGVFKYPMGGGGGGGGGPYKNNARTTIVLKANPSASMEKYWHATRIYIVNKGIENTTGCAADSLNVYGIGPNANAWFKNTTMCGSTPSVTSAGIGYTRNDPVIITFKSDDSGVGEGFHFLWMDFAY